MPLFGKGLKVTTANANNQWTFWAINSQPNWLSNEENVLTGNIYSVRYDRHLSALPGASWSLSSSYFTQPITNRIGYLNFGSFQFNRSERHSFDVLGGNSIEYARSGPDRAQTIGWAGRLNYTYKSPSLSWQLQSYVSSPVYTGFQKGATLLNNQVIWQVSDNTALTARINHFQYNQLRFTSAVDMFRNEYGITTADINLSQRIGALNLSLRPYWLAQNNTLAQIRQKADSYRLSPALSYRGRGNQRYELSYDVGQVYDRNRPELSPFMSQRIISSAGWGPFSFWGYWQKGPYFLSDLITNNPADATLLSATPMVNFSILNNHLVGSIGLNYLYDSFSNEARSVGVGRIQYDVTPNFAIRLDGNATPFRQQSEFDVSQYRLEITKRFSKIKLGHQGQLNLSFFEDANGNGSKEPKELWMDSLLVTINENTLITNAKGTIIYRNIPPGTYVVSAISAGRIGDPLLFHEKMRVERSLTRLIPLARTFQVKGQIRCTTNTFDQQPCQLNRFVVDVERDQQAVSSATPTPDGAFSLRLSPGTYTLLVRNYGRQSRETLKTIEFNLTETGQHPIFDWTFDGAARVVEVVKFSKNLALSSTTNNSKSKPTAPDHTPLITSDGKIPAIPAKQLLHVVTPKQTYYAISRLYGVTVQQLYDWNNLSESSVLSIGQQLVINVPPKQQAHVSKPNITLPTGQSTKLVIENSEFSAPPVIKKSTTYCTVHTGQTLYRIALINKVMVKDLMRWNNLPNYTIEVGQVLQIGE